MCDVIDLCLKDYLWMFDNLSEYFFYEKIFWISGEKFGVKI